MGGEIKHARVVPEDFLRTVSVMHVPVNDQHSLDTVLRLSVSSCDCGVVEQAKPHCSCNCRVMAWRPDQSECPAAILGHGEIDSGDGGARGKPGHFERFGTDARIDVQVRLAAPASGFDVVDQVLAMATRNIFVSCSVRKYRTSISKNFSFSWRTTASAPRSLDGGRYRA
jgi:hypothetical protein